jgi:hypothetical protein
MHACIEFGLENLIKLSVSINPRLTVKDLTYRNYFKVALSAGWHVVTTALVNNF